MYITDKARNLDICVGCGEPKSIGCIVCWECFKYRQDVVPYKYANKTLAEWLQTIPPNWKMRIAQSSIRQ